MGEPVLRKGSTDAAVWDLQQALKARGHDPGPIDGVFGDATKLAVKAFQ
jgi:peptidoglycan hydrolase-like protein with peptidoglycan-binding domain